MFQILHHSLHPDSFLDLPLRLHIVRISIQCRYLPLTRDLGLLLPFSLLTEQNRETPGIILGCVRNIGLSLAMRKGSAWLHFHTVH